MNAVDTNVLVYCADATDPDKQRKAYETLDELQRTSRRTVLLWQVLVEFVNQLRRFVEQGKVSEEGAEELLAEHRAAFPIQIPREDVIDLARDLCKRHSLSHWDGLIIASCLDARIQKLYTEDMGAPTTYDGLQLVNPFV